MIYTNKALFKPLIIILSVLFIPAIIAISISCFLETSIYLFVILFLFLIIYFLCILAVKKESKSKRNFVRINEDNLIVKFDNFSSNNEEVSIRFCDIIQIDYYKINSIVSWIGTICMQCPKIAFLKYICGGKIVQKPMGYFEKKDIEKICLKKKIKLIIH